jgi:hypothetical protein
VNAHLFARAVAIQTCTRHEVTISTVTGLEPARDCTALTGPYATDWPLSSTGAAAGRIQRYAAAHAAILTVPGHYLQTRADHGRLHLSIATLTESSTA